MVKHQKKRRQQLFTRVEGKQCMRNWKIYWWKSESFTYYRWEKRVIMEVMMEKAMQQPWH